MKKKSLKFIGVISMLFLLSGCDLPLQEEFNFKPEVDILAPFENITAWEWIQTRSSTTTQAPYLGSEFDYFKAAIIKADMVEEYNQIATKERTYLLLNNNAFLGAGDVINIITGSAAAIPAGETAEQTMARVDTPAELDKLKAVLRYHIVTTYILQVPTLFTRNLDYVFQTLIPGTDGLIAFRRTTDGSVQWTITVNSPTAPLPATATAEFENVINHNYQFKNGVGHVIADPVRNKPY